MGKLLDIFNPMFNIKEVCKEFVLLEDHLIADGKHCPDCIRKHLLRAEAFAEEAVALDKDGSFSEKDIFSSLPAQIREVGDLYANGKMDKHALGQKVRYIRKELSPYCFGDKSKQKPSGQKNVHSAKSVESSPSWDYWSSIAVAIGLPAKFVPTFAEALKSSADSEIPPYFNLDANGISYRVRANPEWVKKELIKIFGSSTVGRMVSVCEEKGKEYSVEDWKVGILSSLGRTKKQVSFEAPSSSLGEYVDNRSEMKRAYKSALDKNLLGLLRRARKAEKVNTKKSQILAANYFNKIGDLSQISYFWAKAASLYSANSKIAEETKALSKILRKHPNHDLKFWITNRIVMFDKKSTQELKQIFPRITKDGSNNSEQEEDSSRLTNMLKVAGPVAIGFAIGLL